MPHPERWPIDHASMRASSELAPRESDQCLIPLEIVIDESLEVILVAISCGIIDGIVHPVAFPQHHSTLTTFVRIEIEA